MKTFVVMCLVTIFASSETTTISKDVREQNMHGTKTTKIRKDVPNQIMHGTKTTTTSKDVPNLKMYGTKIMTISKDVPNQIMHGTKTTTTSKDVPNLKMYGTKIMTISKDVSNLKMHGTKTTRISKDVPNLKMHGTKTTRISKDVPNLKMYGTKTTRISKDVLEQNMHSTKTTRISKDVLEQNMHGTKTTTTSKDDPNQNMHGTKTTTTSKDDWNEKINGGVWVYSNRSRIEACNRVSMLCSDFRTAFRKATHTVHITGKISVSTPVFVQRNLFVMGHDDATITSPTRRLFTFVIARKGVELMLSNITFKNIGILKTEDEGKFFLSNIIVTGSTSVVFGLKRSKNIELNVTNSSFGNTGHIISETFSAKTNQGKITLKFSESFFNITKGIYIKNVKKCRVTANNCFARDSKCSVLRIIGMKNLKAGEVILRKNSFENCGGSKCSDGGSVYLQYMSKVLLEGNTFIQSQAKYGGALDIENVTNLTVEHCNFSKNSAHIVAGAALVVRVHTSQFSNITFTDNSAGIDAGGLAVLGGATFQMLHCIFSQNKAKSVAGSVLMWKVHTFHINNSTFTNNSAGTDAGGLKVEDGATFQMLRCIFSQNKAKSLAGAVVVLKVNNFHISNSMFSENRADINAGAVLVLRVHTSQFSNSTFTDNSAGIDVGGLRVQEGTRFQMSHCIFSQNKAKSVAGAVYVWKVDNSIIINSTFTNNNAGGIIGGLRVEDGATFQMLHCIISQNRAENISGAVLVLKVNNSHISNSTFTDNSAGSDAGGLRVEDGATFQMLHCTFSQNKAKSVAGAVQVWKVVNSHISNSTFTDNSAGGDVGGLRVEDGATFQMLHCTFSQNKAESNAGAVQVWKVKNSHISNSRFSENRAGADAGGLIVEDGATFQMLHCIFSQNRAENISGAVVVLKVNNSHISNSTFTNNSAGTYAGGLWVKVGATFQMLHCIFSQNKAKSVAGAVQVSVANNSHISNSRFSENRAGADAGGLRVMDGATFQMLQCIFSQNRAENISGAVVVLKVDNSHISNSTFTNNSAGTHAGGLWVEDGGTFQMLHCIFSQNKAERFVGAAYVRKVNNFRISNTTFTTNRAGSEAGGLRVDDGATFQMLNCILSQNKAEGVAGAVNVFRVNNSHISNSMFSENRGKYGGSMRFQEVTEILLISCSFIRNNAEEDGGSVGARAVNELNVTECIFEGNKGGSGGAVDVVYYKSVRTNVYFSHCSFINNVAKRVGHAISNTGHLFLSNSDISSSEASHPSASHIFSQTGRFTLYHVRLSITNTEGMTHSGLFLTSERVELMEVVMLTCPVNSKVKQDRGYRDEDPENVLTTLIVKCEACGEGTYNLTRDSLSLAGNATSTMTCTQCPAGGNCSGVIEALPNFWGSRTESNELVFTPCPSGRCCTRNGTSSSSPCKSIDTCGKGRVGILCGECDNVSRLNIFNDQCIESKEGCNTYLFAFHHTSLSFAFTLIYLCLPLLKKSIVQCFQHLKYLRTKETEINDNNDKVSLPVMAFIELLMFFYQVAMIITVESNIVTDGEGFFESFTKVLTRFFYMEIMLPMQQKICFSKDMNFIEQSLVSLMLKLSTLTNLVIIFCFMSLLNLIRKKVLPFFQCSLPSVLSAFDFNCFRSRNSESMEYPVADASEMQQVNTTEPSTSAGQPGELSEQSDVERTSESEVNQSLGFTVLLQLCLIKLLKFHFTPTVKLIFQLVFCVTINDISRLYLYPPQICYGTWQIVLLVIVVPGLMLFPLSFGMAFSLIRTHQISSGKFLLALIVPYFSIFMYIRSLRSSSSSGERELDEETAVGITMTPSDPPLIHDLLSDEHGIFTIESNSSKVITWQVVQFYRSFVMAFIRTFFIDPIIRTLVYIPSLGMFLVYDRTAKPFRHPFMNILQTLSTLFLQIIVVCNSVASFSLMADLTAIKNVHIMLRVLKYIEFSTYFLLPLSFPLWTLLMKCFPKKKKQH